MSLLLRKALISLQNPNFSSLRLRLFSVNVTEKDDEKRTSFVVSYLKKSLGFSPEMASSVSKRVKFDSPDKPDKAIELFKSFGFTKTQISKLVKGLPEVLVSDTDKTVLPKLEFLKSKGVSDPEIAKTLSNFPSFLTSSLNDQIVPSFEGLGEFFLSDKRTINALKRYPHILCRLNFIAANASVLRDYGVSDSNIALWLERYPRSFVTNIDRFREAVREIADMGFVPSKVNFTHAVRVSLSLSKSTWDSKIRMLRRRGFSKEEISKVFRSFPNAMTCSEKNISETVDFFAAEMGWSRPCSHIAMYPSVLGLSLNKRIIPRCSVFKALLAKGLVKEKNANLKVLLMATEEKFLDKYVRRYENDASELLKLYQEKLGL